MPAPVNSTSLAGTLVPTVLHGMRSSAPAGYSIVLLVLARTWAWLVQASASGLPAASVSKGTAAGRLVPRRRTYCDAVTAGMRKVMRLNSRSPFGPAAQVLLLKVRSTLAVVFFAAAGTRLRGLSCCGLARSTQSSGQAPA